VYTVGRLGGAAADAEPEAAAEDEAELEGVDAAAEAGAERALDLDVRATSDTSAASVEANTAPPLFAAEEEEEEEAGAEVVASISACGDGRTAPQLTHDLE
jgi:hypothetical protein